jgi:hypothetical protein
MADVHASMTAPQGKAWTSGAAEGSKLLTRRNLLICTLCGPPFFILWFIGMCVADLIQPLSPHSSALSIAHTYQVHHTRIRVGVAMAYVGLIFIFPFVMAITAQLRRVEGASPVLTYVQIAAFSSAMLVLVMAGVFWGTAAFRPERTASQIQELDDLAFIAYVFAYPAWTAWMWAHGLAILSDRRKTPIYPRWVGYFNFLVGAEFFADDLVPFFHTGPFTWRGAFPYWLALSLFLIWGLVMTVMTLRSIRQDETREAT